MNRLNIHSPFPTHFHSFLEGQNKHASVKIYPHFPIHALSCLLEKPIPMFDFQKLAVYNKAKQFHISCKLVLSSIKVDRYVKDQLGRASYSIVLNIAEGSAKSSNADRRNYFTISRGSVFECVAVLDILHEEGLLEEDQYTKSLLLADEISRLLFTMIRNLTI